MSHTTTEYVRSPYKLPIVRVSSNLTILVSIKRFFVQIKGGIGVDYEVL